MTVVKRANSTSPRKRKRTGLKHDSPFPMDTLHACGEVKLPFSILGPVDDFLVSVIFDRHYPGLRLAKTHPQSCEEKEGHVEEEIAILFIDLLRRIVLKTGHVEKAARKCTAGIRSLLSTPSTYYRGMDLSNETVWKAMEMYDFLFFPLSHFHRSR